MENAYKPLELTVARSSNSGMAHPNEIILLPCQFCQRLERREVRSLNRATTCFQCRAERVRRRSQRYYQENPRRAEKDKHRRTNEQCVDGLAPRARLLDEYNPGSDMDAAIKIHNVLV